MKTLLEIIHEKRKELIALSNKLIPFEMIEKVSYGIEVLDDILKRKESEY